MITNEKILKLAKTCGFDDFSPEDRVCWECWEEQLIAFAQKIYEMGNDNGWQSREEAEYFNSSYPTGPTGLVGDPQ